MATNSNNVVATAQPLQGNVSDWINNKEQMDFAYRAENREIAKIAREKKEKEDLEYEKYRSSFKDFDIASTGVKSIDEINIQLMMKGKDKQLELFKKMRPDMSLEERSKITFQMQELDNLASYIKSSNEAFVNEAKALEKQISEGKIIPTAKQLQLLKSFSDGTFQIELDDNMKPVIGLWDKDGDGKPDIVPYDKIISQQTFGELIPNINFATTFQAMGKELGSKETGTDNNFVSNLKKFTPIEFAQRTAKASLYDQSGNYTPVAKSWLFQAKGISDWSNVPEETLEEMESVASQIMLDTRPSSDVTKVDNSGRLAASKEARDIRKENEEKATWGVVETPPAYKEAGFTPSSGYKTIAIQGKTVIPALEYKANGKKEIITNGQIQSYTVKTNSAGIRSIVAEVVYEDVKATRAKDAGAENAQSLSNESSATTTTGQQNKTKIVPLTEKDAKIFAVQLGFKDVNQMKDAARSGKENTTTNNNDPLGLGL